MQLILALVLLLNLAINYSCVAQSAEDTLSWNQLEEDLFHANTSFSQGLLSSVSIELFRTSLKNFEVKLIRAQKYGQKALTAKEMCDLSLASLCINASFFDEQRKPLGLLIDRGITIQKVQASGSLLSGVFQIARGEPSIVHRDNFNGKAVTDALQAGPRLISNSKLIPGLRTGDVSERRTGVCIDNKHNLIFFLVKSSLFGVSTSSLQKVLTQDGINCVDALNLDGGSSSQLYYKNPSKKVDFPGFEPIPVGLGLYKISDD